MRLLSKCFSICIMLLFAVLLSISIGASVSVSAECECDEANTKVSDAVEAIMSATVSDIDPGDFKSLGEMAGGPLASAEVQEALDQFTSQETLIDNSLTATCSGCHVRAPPIVQRE